MAEVKDRNAWEARFAKRLGTLTKRHRLELEERLGNPPNFARIGPEFWERVQRESEEEMTALLLLIFIASATQHGMTRDRSQTLANGWSQSQGSRVSQGYTNTARERLGNVERRLNDKTPTKAELRQELQKVFGPERAAAIAATETTVASVAGAEAGIVETDGFSEDDTWFTEKDKRVCPICRPLHRRKRGTWSRFFPEGPPAHPSCRCWIHYANEKRGAAVLAGTS